MNLLKAEFNRQYIIKQINLDQEFKQKLYNLGIIEGSVIKKVYNSALLDPIAYEIKNIIFALRNEDSKYIEVCENNEKL